MLVNTCDFACGIDFKRVFEDSPGLQSRIAAAFGLTQTDTMLYKKRDQHKRPAKGKHVRTIVAKSLILVSRRTAGGG
jgi:hypothetical protein